MATSYEEAAEKADLAEKYSDIEQQYQLRQDKSTRKSRAEKRPAEDDPEDSRAQKRFVPCPVKREKIENSATTSLGPCHNMIGNLKNIRYTCRCTNLLSEF